MILEIIQQEGVNTLLITVKRGDQEVNVELTPDYISTYYLGVNLKQAEDTLNKLRDRINNIIDDSNYNDNDYKTIAQVPL